MKKPLLLTAILVLLLILVASVTVASAARSATQNPPGLEGVRWVLVSFKDAQGKVASAIPGADAYAEFANGKVAGSTGCNRYTAPYEATGNSLKVGQTATTMMACAMPVMDQEAAYLANLQAAATYKIEADQLSIADATAAVVLTYKAEKPAGLVGSWLMTAYNNGKGGFQSAMTGVEVTAVFDDKGQVSGNAGCNSYNAPYTVDSDKIKIGPAVTTRKACEAAIMAQETAYLNALTKAATYKVEGTKLTLRDADGAAMAGYAQAPAPAAQAGASATPATAGATQASASPTPAATGAAPAGAAGAAAAAQPKADTVYLTLRPAADASVQTVVLLLKADGKAEFSQDFGKETPVTLTGAWAESNGVVTVTLTEKDGATLAVPMVMKFARDGTYLNLTDYDKAVWGETGLRLNQAADIARKVRSAMITLDLQAGFPLDPTFVSVNGGGEV
ncbi:MAG: META domain-containing protein, partial [Nitrososphaerales archaeon]